MNGSGIIIGLFYIFCSRKGAKAQKISLRLCAFARTLICFCIIFPSQYASAQQTEKLMLSGTGSDKTVNWEFFCTEGRNSGKWTTIPVPSNWEQFGFGNYNYGHDKDSLRHKEKGMYKYRFTV